MKNRNEQETRRYFGSRVAEKRGKAERKGFKMNEELGDNQKKSAMLLHMQALAYPSV